MSLQELHSLPIYERVALIKALLIVNKGTLDHFRFVPCRTVCFKGDIITWKITPLLEDEDGKCLSIRIKPEDMERLVAITKSDPHLVIMEIKTRLFKIESIMSYTIGLCPSVPMLSPPLRPLISLYKPTPPEARCIPEWMDEEEKVQIDGDTKVVTTVLC